MARKITWFGFALILLGMLVAMVQMFYTPVIGRPGLWGTSPLPFIFGLIIFITGWAICEKTAEIRK